MQSETVHLGVGKGFIVKRKSKFKPEKTGFCNSPSCLCVAQLDDNNRCLRCFNKVVRPFTYDATKKRFDIFLEKNQDIVNQIIFDQPEYESLRIPIIFNKQITYVPLRYFVEYQNLTSTEEYKEDKDFAYKSFFGTLKDICESEKF